MRADTHIFILLTDAKLQVSSILPTNVRLNGVFTKLSYRFHPEIIHIPILKSTKKKNKRNIDICFRSQICRVPSFLSYIKKRSSPSFPRSYYFVRGYIYSGTGKNTHKKVARFFLLLRFHTKKDNLHLIIGEGYLEEKKHKSAV
jgi:hypothetical protein